MEWERDNPEKHGIVKRRVPEWLEYPKLNIEIAFVSPAAYG